jgi:serine/threonine-protein kinase
VPGRNLGEVIRSSGSIAPGLTLDILRQVTSALHKAASQGIVHRDVKPENIMLARSGEVQVADFGLARVQGDRGANLTQIGVTMGTPLYMSPEQIEGRQLDARSDIYSLGITAYHMLAGEPPFTGDSPLSVALQHLNQPPPPLAGRRPDVPQRLAQIIERMIAKKPDDRFSDPAALSGELHAVAGEGVRNGWAEATDHWSLTQMIQVADERADATSRLEKLMQASAARFPDSRSPSWLRIAGAIIGCAVVGGGIAAVSRPASLVEDARSGPPQQDTAWAQIYHAKMADTEAAWLAALNHPAATDYQKNLARQGLVLRYLLWSQDYQDYNLALEQLQQLADSIQPTFRNFGIAGLVVAHTGLNDDVSAYNAYQLLTPEDQSLLQEQAPRMFELLEAAFDELASRAP